ncbi:WD40 repeat-like protein [Xylariaceae sp. FL0662B]|nr:WD40 repeat-like protein [Xylariaceae sp. FL0662B]
MSYSRTKTPISKLGSLSNDISLPADAEDTISSISWSPVANHLAAASWDGKVRVYDVASTGSARGVATLAAEGPLFDCHWAKDGAVVVAAGADKKLHLLHPPTGEQTTLGSHQAPVRSVRFVGGSASIIASGSWDKTVKYWDIRQPDPFATISCKERVYSMDSKNNLLVIATADRHIHLIDLRKPTTFLRTLESPLKHQTRAVTVFPNGQGWGTASIEGRCGINERDDVKNSKINFTFRCHRDEPDKKKVTKVWGVNDIQFHPVHQTVFTTAGSDGSFAFWDSGLKIKLRSYPPAGNAITTARFNRDGKFFAYAVGYDWSMGYSKNSPQIQTKLVLHPVSEFDTTRAVKK